MKIEFRLKMSFYSDPYDPPSDPNDPPRYLKSLRGDKKSGYCALPQCIVVK